MQIKTIHYSALLNLGDYSNEKIGFTAQIDDGETVEQVIETLRQKVKENGGVNADKLYSTMAKGRHELAKLEDRINKATAEWNALAEFLRTQGIKPDAIDMPKFTNLLPEVKEDHSSVVDGEIEEIDKLAF
jgi:dephospho-CoA kinase